MEIVRKGGTPDVRRVDTINLVPDEYRGLDRFEARKRVIADIDAEGLMIMVEDKRIGDTALFADLHKRYVFNLKEKVLEPFLQNENFRRALKDYDSEDFRTYDKRVREDVTFLINNLTEQFGYTEQGAREMCIYVVDNDLAEAFED